MYADTKDALEKIIKERLVDDKKVSFDLDEEDISRIASMIMNSDDKSELNINLQKMFYNDDVKYIFSRLKDVTFNM